MRRDLRLVTVLAATMLMAAAPVRAQDGVTTISYQGVSFSFDAALGTSVAAQQIAAGPAEGPSPPAVAHLSFSVSDVTSEGNVVPGAFRAAGVIGIYPTADLEGEELAAQQLEQLRAILADRPDLADYMTVVPASEHNPLPFLPVAEAAQVLRAKAQYIDTPQLAGIAYVAGFRQDIARFAAGDFWYTFQGISADGAWYVSMQWVLTADGFPRRARTVESDTKGDNWANYLNESIATLNAADPASFTPPLASLDALVQSITFEGVPVEEPAPSPSPSPTA